MKKEKIQYRIAEIEAILSVPVGGRMSFGNYEIELEVKLKRLKEFLEYDL